MPLPSRAHGQQRPHLAPARPAGAQGPPRCLERAHAAASAFRVRGSRARGVLGGRGGEGRGARSALPPPGCKAPAPAGAGLSRAHAARRGGRCWGRRRGRAQAARGGADPPRAARPALPGPWLSAARAGGSSASSLGAPSCTLPLPMGIREFPGGAPRGKGIAM